MPVVVSGLFSACCWTESRSFCSYREKKTSDRSWHMLVWVDVTGAEIPHILMPRVKTRLRSEETLDESERSATIRL